MTTPPDVQALYVHVPFCRVRCGYCDFFSELYRPAVVEPFLEALSKELAAHTARWKPRLNTIFVGGGTPTMLPAEPLQRLLESCTTAAPNDSAEFTVEANPATIDAQKAAVLAAVGVNRASMGAQSFNPAELSVLERTHRPQQVRETMAICRSAGVRSISLDLIFAIPGQDLDSWLASLDQAIALEPEHISCYGLTYEPGTRLHARLAAGEVTAVDPDLEADMYEAAIDRLAAAGFAQYEISNFARPGQQCRHNLVYWRNEPYIGAGPSAAGYVGGERYKNVADVSEYVRRVVTGADPRAETERLSMEKSAGETTMLALRTTEGLNRARFAERFGQDPVAWFGQRDGGRAITQNVAEGLLELTPEAMRLTRRGMLLANKVMADFL
jgi:oxygen-independent coproporphyrinogen-3 oxidase